MALAAQFGGSNASTGGSGGISGGSNGSGGIIWRHGGSGNIANQTVGGDFCRNFAGIPPGFILHWPEFCRNFARFPRNFASRHFSRILVHCDPSLGSFQERELDHGNCQNHFAGILQEFCRDFAGILQKWTPILPKFCRNFAETLPNLAAVQESCQWESLRNLQLNLSGGISFP